MKKLLYFLKIVLFQNIIFIFIGYFFKMFDPFEKCNILFFLDAVIYAFIRSIGISGLLFATNALCVIFIEKKILVYLMLTLNIILYIFVFFEYVLDISGAFRELLVPTVFGVYGGVFLAMLKIKN